MSGILPPTVSGGLPVLGHALEMMRDREKLYTRFPVNMVLFLPLSLVSVMQLLSVVLKITNRFIPRLIKH